MKQEDLRAARLIEAKRRWIENETPRREVEHLADLYETNWTPPEPVSDDLLAAREWHGARWPGEKENAAAGKQDGCFSMEAYLAGCARGRKGAKGLVEERDEAREGLDRLEAAYGILSDDVFGAHPKIAAMAKELSEAKAQRDAALADVRMWEASVAELRKFSWEDDQ